MLTNVLHSDIILIVDGRSTERRGNMLNQKALRKKMIDVGVTVKDLVKVLNISRSAVYYKLTGKHDFTASEISAIRYILHLTNDETAYIFFAESVA